MEANDENEQGSSLPVVCQNFFSRCANSRISSAVQPSSFQAAVSRDFLFFMAVNQSGFPVPQETICTFLTTSATPAKLKYEELLRKLESRHDDDKIDAVKMITQMLIDGDRSGNRFLVPVLKYCLNTENHELKKLLLLFWEVVERNGPDGRLLQEMVLVWFVTLSFACANFCFSLSLFFSRLP